MKVKKNAKISNQYNREPNLTWDTIWDSDKTQRNITHKQPITRPHDKTD